MADVWIAKQDLSIDGARFYLAGDEVSDLVVQSQGWKDLVVRPGTKTAEAVAKPDA